MSFQLSTNLTSSTSKTNKLRNHPPRYNRPLCTQQTPLNHHQIRTKLSALRESKEMVEHFLGQCPATALLRGNTFCNCYMTVRVIFKRHDLSPEEAELLRRYPFVGPPEFCPLHKNCFESSRFIRLRMKKQDCRVITASQARVVTAINALASLCIYFMNHTRKLVWEIWWLHTKVCNYFI